MSASAWADLAEVSDTEHDQVPEPSGSPRELSVSVPRTGHVVTHNGPRPLMSAAEQQALRPSASEPDLVFLESHGHNSAVVTLEGPTMHPQIRPIRYRVRREVGQGCDGKVHEAISETGQRVAIKVIGSGELSRSVRANFEVNQHETNEIAALHRLSHPNIVRLHEAFRDERCLYLVFDYVGDRDLLDFIEQHDGNTLSPGEARIIFRQLASALRYCHAQGVAHRDIKPENILIDRELSTTLIDFGFCSFRRSLSRRASMDESDQTVCGTIDYCAPEELLRAISNGRSPRFDVFQADVFSLGVVLFIMLYGVLPYNRFARFEDLRQGRHPEAPLPPFDVPNAQELEPAVALLQTMLTIDPSQRATMQDVVSCAWLAETRE